MTNNFFKHIKVIILLLIILGIISAGALAGAVIDVIKDTPPVDFSSLGESLGETSTIIDQEGNFVEEIKSVDYREIKPIEEIPQHVQDAFVAVEDERFYQHDGIDIIGIVRSALDNIIAGGIVRGGSTITQQLARDLYLNNERTLDRKIKEAYIAIKMDEALTKDEILEIYLNRIFLGQNSYGIQAASKTYFSKDVEELTIAEAASLASLPQAPTEYALYNTLPAENITEEDTVIDEISINGEKYFAVYNPTFEGRQEYILDKMLELEFISAEEYAQANSQSILASLDPPDSQRQNNSNFYTGIIKDHVARDLMDKFNLSEEDAYDMLYNGGLEIVTTIDYRLQEGLIGEFESFIDDISIGTEEEHKDARFLDYSTDQDGNILNANDSIIYFHRENILDGDDSFYLSKDAYEFTGEGLVISHPAYSLIEGNLIVSPYYSTGDGDLRTFQSTNISIPAEDLDFFNETSILISQRFLDNNINFFSEDESGLYLSSSYYNLDRVGLIQPQASVVVMDQTNGHIKAIVGGRETKRGLNRAYEIVRQPGSTMKPIAVYGPALDTGMTLATVIDDLPRKNANGDLWPINWYGEYRGLTSLRRSLETSSNVNAVNCWEELGLDTSMEYLEKLGLIDGENPENDSFVTREENPEANDENGSALALGGMNYGFSNLDLTAAFAAIANKGTYIEPSSYSKVVDRNGRTILENESDQRQVFDEANAFLLGDAMRSTTEQGVAQNARINGFDVAGKTGTSGTTDVSLDSWYIGYTPYYTVGVWMGADDQQLKISSISNITTSLWREINEYIIAEEDLKPARFKKPSNIIEVEICNQSGKLPTDICLQDHRDTIVTEYFAKGTEPKSSCDTHVIRKINVEDGLLATDKTPRHKIVEQVFIIRKKDYDPEDYGGIVPTDWDMTAPTEYSPDKGVIDTIIDSIFGDDTEETETEETETEITEPPVPVPQETERLETEPVTEPPAPPSPSPETETETEPVPDQTEASPDE